MSQEFITLQKGHRKFVRCDASKCTARVAFDPPRRIPKRRAGRPALLLRLWRPKIAIRCGFCLRVFCLKHAEKHFGSCRDERIANQIADRVVKKLNAKSCAKIGARANTKSRRT